MLHLDFEPAVLSLCESKRGIKVGAGDTPPQVLSGVHFAPHGLSDPTARTRDVPASRCPETDSNCERGRKASIAHPLSSVHAG